MRIFRTMLAILFPCVSFGQANTQPTVPATVTRITVSRAEKTGLINAHGYDPKKVMDQLSNPTKYGAAAAKAIPEKAKIEGPASDPLSVAPSSEKAASEDSGNEEEAH